MIQHRYPYSFELDSRFGPLIVDEIFATVFPDLVRGFINNTNTKNADYIVYWGGLIGQQLRVAFVDKDMAIEAALRWGKSVVRKDAIAHYLP